MKLKEIMKLIEDVKMEKSKPRYLYYITKNNELKKIYIEKYSGHKHMTLFFNSIKKEWVLCVCEHRCKSECEGTVEYDLNRLSIEKDDFISVAKERIIRKNDAHLKHELEELNKF